jgi:tubulin polyglutamylase TTLL4
MKPVGSACGRGIKVINKNSKVCKKRDYLICEYVTNPHLINGLKYDIRIYVLVSSFDPLRVYLFHEGLARFATEKYSTSTKELSKRYVHLTNWSVNKHSQNYQINKDPNADD